jgi:hypothetical protein
VCFASLTNVIHNVMDDSYVIPPDSVLKGSCDMRQYFFVINKRITYINVYMHMNISECVLILI